MCCGETGCACSKPRDGGGRWIQKVMDNKGKKGAPRGKGTLTAQAKREHLSVPQFAKEVELRPEDYDKITKQRVNLYRTLNKFG